MSAELEPLFTDNDQLAGWLFRCPECHDSMAGASKAKVQLEAEAHMRRRHGML